MLSSSLLILLRLMPRFNGILNLIASPEEDGGVLFATSKSSIPFKKLCKLTWASPRWKNISVLSADFFMP